MSSVFSFYLLLSSHMDGNSHIEAATGENSLSTYLIVKELPALAHWKYTEVATSLKNAQ